MNTKYLQLLLAAAATIGAAPVPPAYDVVVRNGRVLDGAGNPWVLADVAIKDGRIAMIGRVRETGVQEIDATDQYVTPGFIDMMDQSGAALLTPGAGENKLRMGVTTIIAGESGTPVAAGKLADYFTRLEKQGIAVNFGTSYSMAQPRLLVMQDKAGAPTPAQLSQMQAEVATAMKAGAFGVTSALIYPPMSFQSTDEIIALAKPAGDCGGFYSTHMRDEGEHLLKAIDEAIDIGEKSGTKVEIYHLKSAWAPTWGKQMPKALQKIADARARGLDIAADLYLYQAGGTQLSITVPNWVWAEGEAKGFERLRSPKVRERLKRDVAAGSLPGWSNLVYAAGGWNRVMLANAYNEKWDKYRFQMIADIAKAQGRDPADVAWDIVIDAISAKTTRNTEELGLGNVPVALFFMMDERDIITALKAPFTSIGSDAASTYKYGDIDAIGLPHPRSYGNAVRVIAEYVKRNSVISLPEAVRKLTSWPATRMGLADRGVIREGMRADIVVLDYDKIDDVADWKNPMGTPTGISYVLVNGQLALDQKGMKNARAGQVLRHTCTAA